MRFFRFIKRLAFVPKCVNCDICLSPFENERLRMHGSICLCEDCYKKWQEECSVICSTCAQPARTCSCVPKQLSKYYKSIPSVIFYDPDKNKIQNKLIFSLKRMRNSEFLSFLSYELYPGIAKLIDSNRINRKDLIFTWIPRKKSSVSKYGFDQGRELSKTISRLFGAANYPLFLRVGGKEQKDLDPEARWNNINRSIILNNNLIGFPKRIKQNELSSFLKGKTVVIIDDVITTGASIRSATELIEEIDDVNVFAASIAKVDLKKT